MSRIEKITDELRLTALSGDVEKTTILLTEWKSLGGSPSQELLDVLEIASANGHAALVPLLLQYGAFVNGRAVAAAVHQAHSITVLQAFLDAGWDINTNFGHTGDLVITSTADLTILEWVLTHGGNPNLHQLGSLSALDVAVLRCSPEVVMLLLKHGAQLNNTNALKTAASFDKLHMINILVEAGADINEIPDYPDMSDLEREEGLGTALHDAAWSGRKEAVELLLKLGADPTIKNSLGKTALDIAKEKQHATIVEILAGR